MNNDYNPYESNNEHLGEQQSQQQNEPNNYYSGQQQSQQQNEPNNYYLGQQQSQQQSSNVWNTVPENRNEERKEKKGKNNKGLIAILIMALIVIPGLFIAALFTGGRYFLSQMRTISEMQIGGVEETMLITGEAEAEMEPAQVSQATEISVVTSDITEVVKHAMPSVVSITNLSIQQVQNFFGGTSEIENTSSGSGIIIGKTETELLVVTNNHVVEGTRVLTVSFIEDSSVEAVIKGTDSSKDLAVIAVKIEDLSDEILDDIKIATLGDSTVLQIGEPVIAIGNALGYGQSVTNGIVSALNRDIGMEGFDSELIQTNAAINPGNSGGPLLNSKGEVIGINTIKVSSSVVEGMGYAIPISDVTAIIESLMNKEFIPEEERGYIGITGLDVSEEQNVVYNMPRGVFISKVMEGSAAEAAGILSGSIITKINDVELTSMEALQNYLQSYRRGERVTLTIQVQDRGGYIEEKVEVTLGAASRPEN